MQPSILNVHTPTSSFAILHSVTQESFVNLCDKLSKKVCHGQRIGPGWLKYEYDGSTWSLDDESDYVIFTWRQQQYQFPDQSNTPSIVEPGPSRLPTTMSLYLHNPEEPLPLPPAYRNPSYYAFRVVAAPKRSPTPSASGRSSRKSTLKKDRDSDEEKNSVPKLMKQFEKFHSENGVRTVIGSIGPVTNVRMLLKSGYRHVYISRKFAQKHGFIPRDATPGHYGYGGLVNIGVWPISLVPSSSADHDGDGTSLLRPPAKAGAIGLGIGGNPRGHGGASVSSHRSRSPDTQKSFETSPLLKGSKMLRQEPGSEKATTTYMQVYLSEEPHFDVVLGRSFFEKRQIRTSAVDPTDIVCLDTGEKVECEVVILKDGKGEIVTVT